MYLAHLSHSLGAFQKILLVQAHEAHKIRSDLWKCFYRREIKICKLALHKCNNKCKIQQFPVNLHPLLYSSGFYPPKSEANVDSELKELGVQGTEGIRFLHGAEEITQTLIREVSTSASDAI